MHRAMASRPCSVLVMKNSISDFDLGMAGADIELHVGLALAKLVGVLVLCCGVGITAQREKVASTGRIQNPD